MAVSRKTVTSKTSKKSGKWWRKGNNNETIRPSWLLSKTRVEISVVDAPTYLDAYKRPAEECFSWYSAIAEYYRCRDAVCEKLKKIYSTRFESSVTSKVSANANIFNIYISRIDTYGPMLRFSIRCSISS